MKNQFVIIHIDDVDAGRTVAAVLKGRKGFSRTLVRKLKRAGEVRVNDCPVYLNARVDTGDMVQVKMPPDEPSTIQPQAIPLEIIYEDEDLLAVNKPVGMLVHPAKSEQLGTLANAMLYHWRDRPGGVRCRPVFRLDRDTTGIVLLAGSHYAAQQLARQMELGQLRKRYLAVVEGTPPDQGTVNLALAPYPDGNSDWTVDPAGRPAVTHFNLLQKFKGASLLALELETGRTHQIRVHMSHLGHPLLGDARYGGNCSLITRQALHAAELDLLHPRSGVPIHLESPLPHDLRELVWRLANTTA